MPVRSSMAAATSTPLPACRSAAVAATTVWRRPQRTGPPGELAGHRRGAFGHLGLDRPGLLEAAAEPAGLARPGHGDEIRGLGPRATSATSRRMELLPISIAPTRRYPRGGFKAGSPRSNPDGARGGAGETARLVSAGPPPRSAGSGGRGGASGRIRTGARRGGSAGPGGPIPSRRDGPALREARIRYRREPTRRTAGRRCGAPAPVAWSQASSGASAGLLAAQLVHHALPVPGARDDPAPLEHLEVAGRAGLREPDRTGKVGHAAGATVEQLDQVEARGFADARHEISR